MKRRAKGHSMANGEGAVSFSPKELFLEINRKIDILAELSHKKADKAELEKSHGDLDHKIDSLESEFRKRLDSLDLNTMSAKKVQENADRLTEQEEATRRQWFAILATLAVGAAGVIVALISMKH